MRFGQSQNRSIQKYWKPHQNTVYWCNLKLAQKRGLQFYQTRSHEIVVLRKRYEKYHKVYQSPRVPRITLRLNSQSGLKDQHDQDARESSNHQSESELSYGETCRGNIDYRIPGIPLSVVQQQDTNRTVTIKKLIQKFESHPNKKSFLQDLNKTDKINKFSQESQKLIADMNNTEIFEHREASSKRQCPDCSLYWEIGIVYCTCRRCLKPLESTKKQDKKN